MYRFEKLRVYNNALSLVEEVYKLTKFIPQDERFSLIDQIKRSSVSIVLNIAGGSGGLGDKEYKSFLRHALKSLYETVAGLKIAKKLFGVDIIACLEKCDVVGRELNALIKSLKTDD